MAELVHTARAAKARRRYYATCTCGWATPGGMSKPDAETAAQAHEQQPHPEETPMTTSRFTTTVTVPGRVIDFYQGGGAYQAWQYDQTSHPDWPEADELELFQACAEAKRIKPSKGGYYVRVELSEEGVEALRYWAQTLETASQDGAADGEQDSRNDLRAARRVLERYGYPRRG